MAHPADKASGHLVIKHWYCMVAFHCHCKTSKGTGATSREQLAGNTWNHVPQWVDTLRLWIKEVSRQGCNSLKNRFWEEVNRPEGHNIGVLMEIHKPEEIWVTVYKSKDPYTIRCVRVGFNMSFWAGLKRGRPNGGCWLDHHWCGHLSWTLASRAMQSAIHIKTNKQLTEVLFWSNVERV